MIKKNIYYLFAIILLTSCSSYRSFDLRTQEIMVGKKYKIARTEKFSKVRITSISDSIVFYKIKGLPQQIHMRDIKKMETKKTDAAKVVAITALTIGVLAVIAASQIDYKITFDTPILTKP